MGAQVFRKKPVEIEAMRFTGGVANANEIIFWIATTSTIDVYHRLEEKPFPKDGAELFPAQPEVLFIETLEGYMNASVGDWIIKGVQGEFYPCKPDIFGATYEDARHDHSEETMQKVYDAITVNGISQQKATDIVSDMQNQGILFRERA